MTDFEEDPLYLSKDTKVFIIIDPNDFHAMKDSERVQKEFRTFGYNNISVQYHVTIDQVNDSARKLGIDLPVTKQDIGVKGVVEWYTFANVLRKARVLEKHCIIAFQSSHLKKDISRSYLNLDQIYHNKDVAVLTPLGCQDILDKAQNFDVDRTLTKKRPVQIIRSFEHTI